MSTMKKLLAALLAVAMVVTGLYVVPTVAEKVQAETAEEWTTADQVPTDMLDVKFQTAADGSVMRFIASVNSLDYYKVGFYVTPVGGATAPYETKTVFERIKSTTEGVPYEFSPKVVDTTSEYFVTAKMNIADPAQYYTVQAYVILRDGTTVVAGAKRCVCANDGLSTTPLNLSFTNTSSKTFAENDKLDVTYTTDNAGTTTASVTEGATVVGVDGTTVHVSVNIQKSSLRSATRFTFTSGEDTVGSEIYRNLYTEYSVVGADTSWYNICESGETKFTIATDADLYGFQSLSITDGFSAKTLYLVSDIKANANTPTTKEEWDAFDKSSLTPWYGIGGNTSWTFTKAFAGVFDGQGHTLSGIYGSAGNTMCYGLFRATASGSTVKNFRLQDSYLTSSNVGLGSIVGRAVGTFNNIYSNAVVINTGEKYEDSGKEYYVYGTGGIIGVVNWAGNATITNCQFDGYAMVYSLCGGGIVGGVYNGKSLTMNYCHNSGTLAKDDTIVEAARLGGLCGDVSNGTLSITNCLNVGARSTTYTNRTGSLIGLVDTNGTATINNTYGAGDHWDSRLIGATSGTVSGNYATSTVTAANIIGYNGTSLSGLDYSNYWTLMADGTPALISHANNGRLYYPDVAWDTTEDGAYKITSPEELSGVAYKVNSGDATAQSASYVLTNDIVLNSGDSLKWNVEAPLYEWIPIGNTCGTTGGPTFNGIFNGCGFEIQGIYMKRDAGFQGLFGEIANATICDMKIVESYMESSQNNNGSFVGAGYGILQKLYSEAILVGTRTSQDIYGRTGGIIGTSYINSCSLEECWFAGTIRHTAGAVGGIVGECQNTCMIKNCLVTGDITSSFPSYIAGICGYFSKSNKSFTLGITDSLFAGSMTLKGTRSYCGTLLGCVAWNTVLSMSNAYATSRNALDENGDTVEIGYGLRQATEVAGTAYSENNNLSTEYWVKQSGEIPTLKCFQ